MHTQGIDHEVVVVGGGFSGIGMAIALERAGLPDYLIIEEGEGFGGTWYWNRYPGVAVDIPSFSYQFSYEQRADWTRVYAPGAELVAYAERCAADHSLYDKVRFGCRVTGARYDEARHVWHLDTSTGDTLVTRYLVDATGVLTQPKRPEIQGVDDFAGVTVHTARWDDTIDLRGKRVAIIGTGASAIQLLPAIAPEVAKVTVFQRTPIWCLPKLDAPLSGTTRRVLARVPGAKRAARVLSQSFVELQFPITAHFHKPLGLSRHFEKFARRYVAKQVADPVLREKLTPKYGLGCKRPSFHNEYLATYNRPNVELETTPIAHITERGVVTETGSEHEIDVLVLATGFKVFEPGNFPKYPVSGRGGVDLEAWWDENHYQAYHGISVPGFPNYFTMFGPYGYNGSSYFNLVETQSRHIIRALQHARSAGATQVEVTREANDRYLAKARSRRGRQIFAQPSCTLANSYYFDRHGETPFRPSLTLETVWDSHRFPLSDYRLETADAPVPVPAG